MPDNRNFILAIALSLAVLLGWTYFISGPAIEKTRLEQERAATETSQQAAQPAAERSQASRDASDSIVIPGSPVAESTTPTDSLVNGSPNRDMALSSSGRVTIATDRLSGSVNLKGARIDDLRLNEYREEVDADSPTIILLSPSEGPDGFFAEFGWQGPAYAGEVPVGTTEWTAPPGATLSANSPLTLTFNNDAGLLFSRTISVDDAYMFTVTDTVSNSTDRSVDLTPYGRLTRIGQPDISGFWILHEGMIGVFGEDGLETTKYKKIVDDREQSWNDVADGWLGITDKYFAATLIPDPSRPFHGRFVYSEAEASVFQADFRQDALTVAPHDTVELTNQLFAGAKVVSIVDDYQERFEIRLFDRLIDWGMFWFITKPLFSVIDWFFNLFGNFGVAILATTVVVKALFFPLASKSYKSMSKMKKVQPEMAEIREKNKDDKAKQQQELMALYKAKKINPVAGCWPIAIQIPVFFALYKVLFVTIEMRHAPFFGWIKDLAAPDPTSLFNLFGLIPWDPPSLMLVGVWPLVMGVSMFVQMKLNPTPPDPTQAMIFTWMPVVFTVMLASFPAGLVIYWAWNNTLSVTQQYVIMRREGVEVDLLGNILATFGLGKPATPAKPAKSGTKTSATTGAKADTGADRAGKSADNTPATPVTPADPDRKVRPKKGAKRSRSRSQNKPGGKAKRPA